MQQVFVCAEFFHYCGPERQNDILGYVENSAVDIGLAEILNHFDTLYQYLLLVAHQNNIADPFDQRVVETYWLGNSLLGNVKVKAFAAHLTDALKGNLQEKIIRLNKRWNTTTQFSCFEYFYPNRTPCRAAYLVNDGSMQN